MDTSTREVLETVLHKGTPAYIATAKALLSGELTWSDQEINEFLDGYLNDPYLTRNK